MMDCGRMGRSPPVEGRRGDGGSGCFRVKRIREGGRVSAQHRHQCRNASCNGSGNWGRGRWLTTSERMESTTAIPSVWGLGGPGGPGARAAIPARRITGGKDCSAGGGVVSGRHSIKARSRTLPGRKPRQGELHQISSCPICRACASGPKWRSEDRGGRAIGEPMPSADGETKAK